MSVDEEEVAVRAFLQAVILRASKDRRPSDMPNLQTMEVWSLMRATAALGYNIDISIRSGTGEVTADWQEVET